MNLETITIAAVEFIRAHQAYAPLIVGLMTFGESFAFVSLILPMITILVAVGFALAAADVPFWQVWLGAAAGAFVSAWISYELGFKVKKRAYGVWPLSRNPDMIERGELFFQRFGPWAMFLGRFFGPTRAILPLIAGIFMMPRVLFQAANMASASVWAFALLAPGAGLAHYVLW
ncbi:DedA family protein [Microvirga sp. KLBC 81]|uniref:DedA family protein n=1 Tax=Microvirga sp. KLBC 81 TaxID=1862707 RepID=UPI00197C2F9D|nr:DedA family protein [Microvirga sp. KLBC 81]